MFLNRLPNRKTLRARAASEDGFAIGVALGVLTVVTLLIGAAFVAAKGDINNSQHDLDSKRAFYAARAGLNAFLYQVNKNTEFWEQCPHPGRDSRPRHGQRDVLLPAASRERELRMLHRGPGAHDDRAQRRQLPDAVHG